jgi:hypothetical protein
MRHRPRSFSLSMMLRAVVAWFALMVLAIANGTMREFLLTPRVGPKLGHVLSTVLLCAFVFAVARLLMPWIGAQHSVDAWKVGALWVALTLAFEFLVGHYVFQNSWEKLLADYNISQGRIWVLVPISTLIAPRLALITRI